jgi:hypothetical protein
MIALVMSKRKHEKSHFKAKVEKDTGREMVFVILEFCKQLIMQINQSIAFYLFIYQ